MLKQSLQQRLLQKLSPQQIQLMKLIQLPTIAFEQRLNNEIEENPALEEGKETDNDEENLYDEENFEENDSEIIEADDINIDEYLSDDEVPSYKTQANNYSPDDEEKRMPYVQEGSFIQDLVSQINTFNLTEDDKIIAEFLIGSIDSNGYINLDIETIIDELAFTQNISVTKERVEELLARVHQIDPPGIGARNLRECLLIQLKRKKRTPSTKNAIKILEDAFDSFVKKHYQKLIQKYNLTEDQLKEVIIEIEKLNPKPGGFMFGNSKMVSSITPDFIIRIVDGELELALNSRNVPDLKISNEFKNILTNYKNTNQKTKTQKEAVFYVKQKIDSAKWFIQAIEQRQQTLLLNMTAIMERQKEYFLTGDEQKLKPMILKDIAEATSMDISTVSRVANSKYVETPYGVKLIKEFFSESITNEKGEEISTKEIKVFLEKVIKDEDKKKPLTDDKLSELLKGEGYPIARRTVAKYREQLDIPVARLRKKL